MFGRFRNWLIHPILERLKMAKADLDALTQQVTDIGTVEKAAVTLLQGLKAKLDAAIASSGTDDGAALQALSAQLGTSKDDLAAAIVANTPADPDAPPADGTPAA